MANSYDLAATVGRWISDDGEIRVNAAAQPSVFDMIRVLGGQRDPHKCWKRLTDTHPEVRTKCPNFQFPGRGQRPTPVAKDKEAILYILGLLPGEVGRKYREQSAKLFAKWIEDPAGLVGNLAEQLNEDGQKWVESRLKVKRTQKTFTDGLQMQGVTGSGYADCNNAVYVPMFGGTARQLKDKIAEKNGVVPAKIKSIRDEMTLQELNDLETAQRVSISQLQRQTVFGNAGCERVVRKSSQYVRQLLDGEIDIPGLS